MRQKTACLIAVELSTYFDWLHVDPIGLDQWIAIHHCEGVLLLIELGYASFVVVDWLPWPSWPWPWAVAMDFGGLFCAHVGVSPGYVVK